MLALSSDDVWMSGDDEWMTCASGYCMIHDYAIRANTHYEGGWSKQSLGNPQPARTTKQTHQKGIILKLEMTVRAGKSKRNLDTPFQLTPSSSLQKDMKSLNSIASKKSSKWIFKLERTSFQIFQIEIFQIWGIGFESIPVTILWLTRITVNDPFAMSCVPYKRLIPEDPMLGYQTIVIFSKLETLPRMKLVSRTTPNQIMMWAAETQIMDQTDIMIAPLAEGKSCRGKVSSSRTFGVRWSDCFLSWNSNDHIFRTFIAGSYHCIVQSEPYRGLIAWKGGWSIWHPSSCAWDIGTYMNCWGCITAVHVGPYRFTADRYIYPPEPILPIDDLTLSLLLPCFVSLKGWYSALSN